MAASLSQPSPTRNDAPDTGGSEWDRGPWPASAWRKCLPVASSFEVPEEHFKDGFLMYCCCALRHGLRQRGVPVRAHWRSLENGPTARCSIRFVVESPRLRPVPGHHQVPDSNASPIEVAVIAVLQAIEEGLSAARRGEHVDADEFIDELLAEP